MNYRETIEFLYSQLPAYHRIGKAAYKNDLGNSIALDEYFGHPHRLFPTIHVAGTNGKGSVSHLTASVLQEAGYRTGLYTSPHLIDFRERIRINGKMIPKRDVTGFVKRHQGIIRSLNPSFFEMTVAMAFDHFAKGKVDVAVIETGLGGRLDSTNIITPVLSVITNIGHDHMDLLGGTLEKLAFEKAGIFKRSVPVVVGEKQPWSSDIFIMRAAEENSRIEFADNNFSCLPGRIDYETGERGFEVTNISSGEVFNVRSPLAGDYQAKNLVTLFQIFRTLSHRFPVTGLNLTDGIRSVTTGTGLTGRWQILDKNPLTICDTGHNREGLEYVVAQLKELRCTRLNIVLGFVSDKDLGSLLPLFPADARYFFTKAPVPRALDEKILQGEAARFGLKGKSYPTVKQALKAARSEAGSGDVVFIGGSTFVVAEVV